MKRYGLPVACLLIAISFMVAAQSLPGVTDKPQPQATRVERQAQQSADRHPKAKSKRVVREKRKQHRVNKKRRRKANRAQRAGKKHHRKSERAARRAKRKR